MATYPTTGSEKPPEPDDGKAFTDVKDVSKPGDQKLVAEPVKGTKPSEMAVRWERELQAAKKELAKFHRLGKKLNAKYLDKQHSFPTTRPTRSSTCSGPTSRC